MIGGTGGELLSALLVGGAFAAFLSTSSGLTVAVAGVVSQDVLDRWLAAIAAFRVAAVFAVAVPSRSPCRRGRRPRHGVGLAFAVAASTFCPLLVLGIWWRRLTDAGAIAGLLVGGVASGAAVVRTFLAGRGDGWPAALLSQPAAWTIPLAFMTMVVGSLLTPDAPADARHALWSGCTPPRRWRRPRLSSPVGDGC